MPDSATNDHTEGVTFILIHHADHEVEARGEVHVLYMIDVSVASFPFLWKREGTYPHRHGKAN